MGPGTARADRRAEFIAGFRLEASLGLGTRRPRKNGMDLRVWDKNRARKFLLLLSWVLAQFCGGWAHGGFEIEQLRSELSKKEMSNATEAMLSDNLQRPELVDILFRLLDDPATVDNAAHILFLGMSLPQTIGSPSQTIRSRLIEVFNDSEPGTRKHNTLINIFSYSSDFSYFSPALVESAHRSLEMHRQRHGRFGTVSYLPLRARLDHSSSAASGRDATSYREEVSYLHSAYLALVGMAGYHSVYDAPADFSAAIANALNSNDPYQTLAHGLFDLTTPYFEPAKNSPMGHAAAAANTLLSKFVNHPEAALAMLSDLTSRTEGLLREAITPNRHRQRALGSLDIAMHTIEQNYTDATTRQVVAQKTATSIVDLLTRNDPREPEITRAALRIAIAMFTHDLREVKLETLNRLAELLAPTIASYKSLPSRAAAQATHYREAVASVPEAHRAAITAMDSLVTRGNILNRVNLSVIDHDEAEQLRLIENIEAHLRLPENLRQSLFPESLSEALSVLATIQNPSRALMERVLGLLTAVGSAGHFAQSSWPAQRIIEARKLFNRTKPARQKNSQSAATVAFRFNAQQARNLLDTFATYADGILAMTGRYQSRATLRIPDGRTGVRVGVEGTVDGGTVGDSELADGRESGAVVDGASRTPVAHSVAPNEGDLDMECYVRALKGIGRQK